MNPLGGDLAVLEVRLRYIYPNMREDGERVVTR